MRYLLVTNVISALRVPHRNPAVRAWAASVPLADQYVAALTIAEIERGAIAHERNDPVQGRALRTWFSERVLSAFSGRVVPFGLEAARVLAAYRVPEHAPFDDALIAATADAQGMVVVTRNVRNFAPLGVRLLDPWHAAAE